MKISAEVLGVEQAMNFQTMEQDTFVVVEIFGVTIRAPITEEQMEALVTAALGHAPTAGIGRKYEPDTFEETRSSGVPEHAHGAVQEDTPERNFSVMAELTENGGGEESYDSGNGVLDLFSPSTEEEEKIAALRARPALGAMRDAPQPAHPSASASVPRLPGLGGADDEGIPQD